MTTSNGITQVIDNIGLPRMWSQWPQITIDEEVPCEKKKKKIQSIIKECAQFMGYIMFSQQSYITSINK